MPQAEEEELQKHTLHLYAGDYAKLRAAYPEIGAAIVIRRAVRGLLKQLESGGGGFDPQVEVNL